jgi:xylan 1,4-beta-xylosidase
LAQDNNQGALTPEESFHSHHAPFGAFATFTLGLVGSPGGFGYALRGPARQNVYVGFRVRNSHWHVLPFLNAPQSNESAFTGEAAKVEPSREIQLLDPTQYQRTLGWASDTWRADEARFGFSLLSPFDSVPDPIRLKKPAARLALSPHINGWIEYDNSRGNEPVELLFGIGEPDSIFHPLQDTDPNLLGFGLGTQFAYATTPESRAEPRQGFNVFEPQFRDFRGLSLIGGESALVFTVPAGKKKRFPLVFAFFCQGTATTGIPTQYAYTRCFKDLPDVAAHGLKQHKHYEQLAAKRDAELQATALSAEQQFLVAQATHSYLGNTQLLWDNKGPLWVVNEGEYRMMNTFDLTVDHLFFELKWFPWAVRNTLDLFVSRYSYVDRLQLADGKSKRGGISFTHDMGVQNNFTPVGRSSYECDHLSGCFSHMTMEQLLNWVLCSVTYAIYTGDIKWLRSQQEALQACAESLQRRDNPVATERNGVLKHDTLRCGLDGSEITTYDSLDASLGQARNSLYLSVKTLAAWTLLEEAFGRLKLSPDKAAAVGTADLLAATLVNTFDTASATFPAVFEAGNASRIVPAIEGFAYPLFLGFDAVTDRSGRFAPLLDLLSAHLKTILRPGVCLDATSGAWKMSSTSTNTWFSKIAISQYVVRRLFPEVLTREAADADRIHAQWQKLPGCGAYAMCDQIRSDTGETCGSRYYPRGVTAALWLTE